MQNEDKYLVEVFYKIPHKNKRVFSFISRDSAPAPSGLWSYIERGITSEFETSSYKVENLCFKVTWLPEG